MLKLTEAEENCLPTEQEIRTCHREWLKKLLTIIQFQEILLIIDKLVKIVEAVQLEAEETPIKYQRQSNLEL